jgi:hypothetical protein
LKIQIGDLRKSLRAKFVAFEPEKPQIWLNQPVESGASNLRPPVGVEVQKAECLGVLAVKKGFDAFALPFLVTLPHTGCCVWYTRRKGEICRRWLSVIVFR